MFVSLSLVRSFFVDVPHIVSHIVWLVFSRLVILFSGLTENNRKHIKLEALQNSSFVDNESVAQEILGSLNQPVFRGLSAVAFRELDESVIASHPGEALPADRFSSTTEQPNQPTVQPNQLTTIAGPTNAPRDPPMVEVQPGSSHTENRSSLSDPYFLISTSTDSRSYAFVNPFADTEENLPQQRPTRATFNPDSSPYDADTDTSKPKSGESKLERSKSI